MRHHRIGTNGITLHVVEHGEGPAVLLCHGFPAIWSSWRSQMEALAQAGYHALAPDMRGYGESDAPEAAEAYTPFHTVGDLVGILDNFGLATAVVVGHDFGASIAWNAALLRPDRFRAVFGMSVPVTRPSGASFLDALRAAGRDDFYMFRQMRPEADRQWAEIDDPIARTIYWSSGLPPEGERWHPFNPDRGFLRPAPALLPGIDLDYLRAATASFARTVFHGPLNYYRAIDRFFAVASGAFAGLTIRQPAFFLTGARDGLNAVRPTSETSMRADLQDLRGFVVLDEVGHWPQLEAPAAVDAALVGFLADVAANGA